MSESEKGHGEAEVAAAERERHEQKINEVIERLNRLGYVRRGEWLGYSFPEDPTRQKWLVRLETRTLGDQASVDERKKQFPGEPDMVTTILRETGYRVDVDYDMEKSDSKIDHLVYNLYEDEK